MSEQPFQPFDVEAGLILAIHLPGSPADFGHDRLGWNDLASTSGPSPLWINLDRTKSRAQQWLREQSGLDPIVAESLLAEETRPRAQPVNDGLLVILRSVNMNPGAQPDELIAIRMWIEPTRVITLRQYRFQTIAELRARAQQGQAPATPGAFLAAVAMGLAVRLGPTVENLQEMLDEIENNMLERESEAPADRARLATIRRQAISYRRYLVPQRDALLSLSATPSPLLLQHDHLELRVAAEHVARVTEALEEVRDRAAVTQEELRARNESRMGRTLYLLTIIATVALPLGLVTGLLGVNVGGMPLADSPLGFAIVCMALLAIAGVEILLFRSMKWL